MTSQNKKNLRRRDFLAMGIAASIIGGTVASCGRKEGSEFRFFSARQAQAVQAMCEQIIPADQDPGATQAGVIHYIDTQLTRHFKQHQKAYAEGIEQIDSKSVSRFQRPFAELASNQQIEVLKDAEKTMKPFFDLLLAHTMQGFYGDPRHGGNRDMASWRMLGLACPPVRGRARF